MAKTIFIWDDENVPHLAAHGLTPEDVERIVSNPMNQNDVSESSGLPVTFGMTKTTPARYIIVVWEELRPVPRTVRVKTAYDVPRPNRSR